MKRKYIKPITVSTVAEYTHVIASSDPGSGNGVGTGWNAKGNGDWAEEENEDNSAFGW